MTIQQLKNKYKNAHQIYLKYRYSNNTNNIEVQNAPEIKKVLSEFFPNSVIIPNNDNFLNYIGIDYIIYYKEKVITVDSKICNNVQENKVMIDAFKKDIDGNLVKATEFKVNDFYLFKNYDNFHLVSVKEIENLMNKEDVQPKDCFYLSRDLYKTTMKYIANLENCKKLSKKIFNK